MDLFISVHYIIRGEVHIAMLYMFMYVYMGIHLWYSVYMYVCLEASVKKLLLLVQLFRL